MARRRATPIAVISVRSMMPAYGSDVGVVLGRCAWQTKATGLQRFRSCSNLQRDFLLGVESSMDWVFNMIFGDNECHVRAATMAQNFTMLCRNLIESG